MLAVASVAVPASAATSYYIEGVLTDVTVLDLNNDEDSATTGQVLSLGFTPGSGKFCNVNNAADITSASTALFDSLVRQAQSAFLAGKTVRIRSFTPNSIANCKLVYLISK